MIEHGHDRTHDRRTESTENASEQTPHRYGVRKPVAAAMEGVDE